ncbi:MAG: hypothetical protein ACE5OT_03570 [Candidatus Hadarchaeaceae archaeon]
MVLLCAINFWDLPSKQTFVVLSEQYVQSIYKSVINLVSNNLTKAARLIGNPKSLFYYLKCGKRIRTDKLLKLLNFLSTRDSKFSPGVAQKHLIWIGPKHGKGIHNPRFPVDPQNPAFVRTAARACGDGILTRIYAPRHGYGSLVYFAKEDPEQLQNAIMDAITSFGGSARIYRVNSGKDVYLVYPTVVRDALLAAGVTTSPKAESKRGILEFVMKSEREAVWAAWLQQTGDDEGHVVYHPQYNLYGIYWRRSVDITGLPLIIQLRINEGIPFYRLPIDAQKYVTNHPPKMLLDEQELLNRFDITSTVRPLEIYQTLDGKLRAKWQLRVSGPDNLIQYGKKVGFRIARKSITLAKAIKQCLSYEKFILPILNNLRLKHGYLDGAMISAELGGSQVPHSDRVTMRAIVALREMSKRGYIRKISRGRYIKKLRKFILSRYDVTEKGIQRCDKIYKT